MPFVNLSSLQNSNVPPGPIGYTGSQGIPGEAAAIGFTGSQGSSGYTGSAGSAGIAETLLHPFMFIQGI